jgi:chromate transporter
MTTSISLARVGWVFLHVGALSFGGLGATLALIETSLVTRLGVLTRSDVTGALTHTKLLPGSTVVQVVAYLGWRLRGWPGSALATAAFILPSALAMVVLGYGYVHADALPGFAAVRRGVVTVVIALLLGTMARLARQTLTATSARLLAVVAFAMVVALPSASPWVVVGAGLLGMWVYWGRSDGSR